MEEIEKEKRKKKEERKKRAQKKQKPKKTKRKGKASPRILDEGTTKIFENQRIVNKFQKYKGSY